jgi:O-antigen/teichoic acid export membrane protein
MRRPALGRNVIANMASVVMFIATAGISVPLILEHVGLAGYGIWTVALTAILYVTVAESGLGPAVQRFVAVARGGGDLSGVSGLLWTSIAIYALVGVLLMVALLIAAPALVDVFDAPRSLRGDAEYMFRVAGVVIAVALLVTALGNVQQGLERFVSFAVTAVFSSVAYLTALVILLSGGGGLREVAIAALIQQGVLLAGRIVALRDILFRRPELLSRTDGREIASYSARLQLTVLSTLVNSQTDKIVVGVVAPATTLGQLGIGAQVAESGRNVHAGALSPIISRLSRAHGERDGAGLSELFARLNRLWLVMVVGTTAIGLASLYPLIESWLGPGHGDAALLGGFLVLAYGVNMLTGSGIAYLRAVGRPGLEARYGAIVIVLNVIATIALGLAAGAVGVVAATATAYTLGTIWFARNLRREAPGLPPRPLAPALAALPLALVCAAVALGWGLLAIELLPTGASIVPVALGAGVAFVAYVVGVTGVRPTRENLRALVA